MTQTSDAHTGAVLILSDSAARTGSPVHAIVQVTGAGAASIASLTGRLAYDSTALRFTGEVVPATPDGAMRVSNPTPGLVRLAALSVKGGFAGGEAYRLRFEVLRDGGLASLRLTIDEMHTVEHADAVAPRER
jgi:hypothetical protein